MGGRGDGTIIVTVRSAATWTVLAFLPTLGCARPSDEDRGEDRKSAEVLTFPSAAETEPVDRAYYVEQDHGGTFRASVQTIDASMRHFSAPTYTKDLPALKSSVPKLDAALDALLARSATNKEKPPQTLEVVVTFRETLKIPNFPAPIADQPRTSLDNQLVHSRALALVAEITAARAPFYEQATTEFATSYNAVVKDTLWLINAALVDAPADRVRDIAMRDDVAYVELNIKESAPGAGTILNGRTIINSDAYFGLPQPSSWIATLDTGVRSTHTLLTNLGFVKDCNTFAGVCNGGNPGDTFWNHGTAVANVLNGNSNLGNDFRGVTAITVDSFKVWGNSALNVFGYAHGSQDAITASDRVIVTAIQDASSDTGSISSVADNTFDAGVVVLAIAGNFGPGSGTVRAPGNAAKVIAAGGIDAGNQAYFSVTGQGPTSDGRTKPDVLAPTCVGAASNSSDTASATFCGTSFSAPHVAGAAAFVRNFMRYSSGSPFEFLPGTVNAFLIMAGNNGNASNAANDNTYGAGTINLPNPSTSSFTWGNVNVTSGQIIDIPVSINSASRIDAALWWPEASNQIHSDIDLHLIRPDGTFAGTSQAAASIFEKVRANAPLTSGTWKLRIQSFNSSGTQAVYFALARQ